MCFNVAGTPISHGEQDFQVTVVASLLFVRIKQHYDCRDSGSKNNEVWALPRKDKG